MAKTIVAFAAIALATSALGARGEDAPAGGPNPAEMFGQLDTNKDGAISADEVPEERKRLFERLVRTADKNSDGKLDKDEFAAGLAGPPKNEGEGDRPSDPKAEGERLERMLGRLDANNDGKVALDEVPEERRAGFEKLLERGDKDGDKALSKEEFASVMPSGEGRPDKKPGAAKGAKRPEGRPEPGQLFARLDANGDGKVTLDEVPEQARERIERLIKMADKDGDGAVSKEEAAALPRPDGAPGRPGQGRPEGDRRRPPPGLFVALDSDHDGKLSSEEITASAEVIRKLDTDGDGSVTIKELLVAGGQDKPGKEKE